MGKTFKSPVKAWEYLTSSGGLEPEGRDELFVERLRERLDPTAPDVQAALSAATIERFLNAFFGLLTPFADIMRDLLNYFERAEATEGPGEWVLVLGGAGEPLRVNLDHFKRWLEVFSKNAYPIDVLDLPPPTMWKVWDAFKALRAGNPEYRLGGIPAASPPDLRQWLGRYEQTGWLPLPEIVHRNSTQTRVIRDYANFISEFAAALSSVFPNYDTLRRELRREDLTPEIATYALHETDRWIQSSVLNLTAFENASKKDKVSIEAALTELFRDIPRRRSRFQFSGRTLTEVVSLPVWKKRYELYSAWVFTQILQALAGHDVSLHNDRGTLKFAFHETPLATINSASRPITLFSEKRVPARDLQGHGRIRNIQPDYSAWADDTCPLAVECKHYKKSSTNFDLALADYSRNLQGTAVLLVNYGPISAHLKAMTAAGGDGGRRFAWGNVNPDFPEQLDEFRKTVRRAIGEPISISSVGNTVPSSEVANAVLIIDVSTSMSEALRRSDVQEYALRVMQRFTPAHLVAVDEVNRGTFDATEEGLHRLAKLSGGGTALLGPARGLLDTYDDVLVLTDEDGLHTLGAAANVIEKGTLILAEVRNSG